jgi:hypothetical protein
MYGTGEHHLLKMSLRRLKAICSHSYADYRPTTDTTILWASGHAKVRPLMGGIEQGKETQNLNMLDMFTVQE